MKNYSTLGLFIFVFFANCFTVLAINNQPDSLSHTKSIKKVKDIVIYEDPQFFTSFPSIVRNENGELIVAFRRALDRKIFNEITNHIDANSYLVFVRSEDNGLTWTKKPELISAYPFGGSQDPCLLKLKDGEIICTSYAWAFLHKAVAKDLKQPVIAPLEKVVLLGGYIMRSADMGSSWQGPFYPPHILPEAHLSAFGEPVTAYNRGALCEGSDGSIYWVVAANRHNLPTGTYLLISKDKGYHWQLSCPVAVDNNISFNETSVYETPKGDLVAFMRTSNFDGQACIARSKNGGKSFGKWKSMGFKGYPLHALRLPDNRVLLTYGYRFKPYGIRARILNAECTDYDTAEEIVIRSDGGSDDIGYTWSVMLDENRVLVTYYYNFENETRFIAGSILEIN